MNCVSLEGSVADELGIDAAVTREVNVLHRSIETREVFESKQHTSNINPYCRGEVALPPLAATVRSKALAEAATAARAIPESHILVRDEKQDLRDGDDSPMEGSSCLLYYPSLLPCPSSSATTRAHQATSLMICSILSYLCVVNPCRLVLAAIASCINAYRTGCRQGRACIFCIS